MTRQSHTLVHDGEQQHSRNLVQCHSLCCRADGLRVHSRFERERLQRLEQPEPEVSQYPLLYVNFDPLLVRLLRAAEPELGALEVCDAVAKAVKKLLFGIMLAAHWIVS